MDGVARLREIMRRLRDPEGGCPWDRLQTFDTIAPYTIEEAYEVAEAIDLKDWSHLRDELGDLLFQVVFHAQMAEEEQRFAFDDVVEAICDKLERRHPHVFADQSIGTADAQSQAWEQHKINEAQDAAQGADVSVLAGVSGGIPEWMRALKLQKRAASVGFDWDHLAPVLDKVREELAEIEPLLAAGSSEERRLEEFGDLLFACCNLARHLQCDPGRALRQANAKFERRFRGVERLAQQRGQSLEDMTLAQMDALWEEVKAAEATG